MAAGNTPTRASHLKNKDQVSGTAWLGTNLLSDIKVHVSRASSHVCGTVICLRHTFPAHTLHDIIM